MEFADELFRNNVPIIGLEVCGATTPALPKVERKKHTRRRLPERLERTGDDILPGKRKRVYRAWTCICIASKKRRESSLKVEGSESWGHRLAGGGYNWKISGPFKATTGPLSSIRLDDGAVSAGTDEVEGLKDAGRQNKAEWFKYVWKLLSTKQLHFLNL